MSNQTGDTTYEVWLRGPVDGVPALLQPVAQALLQSVEESRKYTKGISPGQLWQQPAGRASIGFHLQHITGVLDRMLTYSKGQGLSNGQFEYLKNEGKENTAITAKKLISDFEGKVMEALEHFKSLSDEVLKEKRSVGRKNLPSTVIGLLFHSAEHSQRHIGQLLVTASVLKNYGHNT